MTLELNDCAARFGAKSGLVAEEWSGEITLRRCVSSWNAGYGFLFQSGGGTLDLHECQFTRNVERGLQIGESGSAVIPGKIRIRSGSFSENGWTDYNLSTARKYEYGILVWGSSPTTLDIRGTADDPVLFLANFCRGLRIDNSQARLERIEHAVFAGRHQQSALDLVSLDLSANPVIRHCAFAANAALSYHHSQVTLSDENTAPATFTFDNCTFYNVAGKGYHHVAVECLGDPRTENLTLRFNRCIFAGGPAGQGADELALYLDGINCAAEFRDCALVTEGPYALNPRYAEANLAGHGNRVTESGCIHADPNFVPSRCTLPEARHYAAAGDFLKPRADAFRAVPAAGRVGIGGYNLQPAPAAATIRPVRVAVYADEGPEAIDIAQTTRILQGCTDVAFEEIKAREIWTGGLERFDVILFPGGSSALESRSLKARGRQLLQEFIRRGGGYIGTCAGAYLILPGSGWGSTRLGLMEASCVDAEHWARGHGIVQIKLTPAGREILGAAAELMEIEYWQGPLMAPLTSAANPRFVPLATFASEIHDKGAPAGVMAGTTAIAAGQHGAGRFVAFSPHPEAVITPLFNGDLVYHAVQWAAKRKPASAASGITATP